MPKNIFKIYDGRTNFWQWDTGQKLIVLDDTVTEVHFSNRNMEYSRKATVYTDAEGFRIVHIPDLLLQLPQNLVAYAYADNGNGTSSTVKSVKFAVVKRPIPADYITDEEEPEDFNEIKHRLEILERVLREVMESGTASKIQKFENMDDAILWAKEEEAFGAIVAIKFDNSWIAHIVEDDYSITPICNCDGEMVRTNLFDGGDGDGYDNEEILNEVQIWDGGGAAGF